MNENEIKLEKTIIREYDAGSKGYRMDTIWYILNNLKSTAEIISALCYCFKGQVKFNKAAFKHQNWKDLFLGEQE